MFEPFQRALDLTARFDYEYWLGSEILKNLKFFADEEIIEKLPPDLRELVGKQSAETEDSQTDAPIQVIEPAGSEVSIVDLTVKTLGFVEIFRDRAKPFAADAWTTKRARDIFCFVATSAYRRVDKDV